MIKTRTICENIFCSTRKYNKKENILCERSIKDSKNRILEQVLPNYAEKQLIVYKYRRNLITQTKISIGAGKKCANNKDS